MQSSVSSQSNKQLWSDKLICVRGCVLRTQVEHGGLPGVFLQPIEKPMEQVLRDYHELLCGPVSCFM